MNDLREQIVNEMNAFIQDSLAAVNKGTKTAGARSRKNTINLQKLFKQWRKESVAATKK